MYPFKRIMVGLDLTSIDDALVRYTAYLCQLLKPEALYFVHVYKDFSHIEEHAPAGTEPDTPLDEQLIARMQKFVAEMLKPDCTAAQHFEVLEGQAAEELLRWSHLKQIDLFVAGIKPPHSGTCLSPQRFTMLSDCSVLLVPASARVPLQTLLVPVDFSEFSATVVRSALNMVKQLPGAQIELEHVFQVPIGYYKTGLTFEKFAEIMRFNASKEYHRFCHSLQVETDQLPCHFQLSKEGDLPSAIMASVREVQPSLLIMGSQGRTAFSSIFLGSISEKVIRLNHHSPTLVMKRKGKNLNLLEALFAD